jgi:hypothetical protein
MVIPSIQDRLHRGELTTSQVFAFETALSGRVVFSWLKWICFKALLGYKKHFGVGLDFNHWSTFFNLQNSARIEGSVSTTTLMGF